ncbi:MAG: hypothetical protein J5654_04675 [Victivallales bacterium]|nr:hypothetical protein [Victivallales bacterium]
MAIGLPGNIWGRRKPPVEFYLCECPKCGFSQDYEVTSGEVIQIEPPAPDDPITVLQLPEKCPKCGAKWRKRKMPSGFIQ